MVKLYSPLYSEEASGKFANRVYSHRGGTQIGRKLPVRHHDAKTPAQLAVRNSFRDRRQLYYLMKAVQTVWPDSMETPYASLQANARDHEPAWNYWLHASSFFDFAAIRSAEAGLDGLLDYEAEDLNAVGWREWGGDIPFQPVHYPAPRLPGHLMYSIARICSYHYGRPRRPDNAPGDLFYSYAGNTRFLGSSDRVRFGFSYQGRRALENAAINSVPLSLVQGGVAAAPSRNGVLRFPDNDTDIRGYYASMADLSLNRTCLIICYARKASDIHAPFVLLFSNDDETQNVILNFDQTHGLVLNRIRSGFDGHVSLIPTNSPAFADFTGTFFTYALAITRDSNGYDVYAGANTTSGPSVVQERWDYPNTLTRATWGGSARNGQFGWDGSMVACRMVYLDSPAVLERSSFQQLLRDYA